MNPSHFSALRAKGACAREPLEPHFHFQGSHSATAPPLHLRGSLLPALPNARLLVVTDPRFVPRARKLLADLPSQPLECTPDSFPFPHSTLLPIELRLNGRRTAGERA